ncbi:hypothetical protein yc1106_06058 [Curvularia clavata]|uniref:Uncharacterized protein n=1 Tax=Curvularia clavata TaxID=95742 RepID=A0A9Q8ZC74_CURCL|nr:hypothetical protein yc1106_06058 [Curvularia clavata]
MVPFTDLSVETGCISTDAAMASMPAPTIKVAPVADENTDPSSTTNSARFPLQKSSRPAALKSRASPGRQRFLRETKMSLMTSSPRTPTRGQTTARARGTPSSAKLEIGRDSFYFSMDLPPSKITPKKGTTPKKQSPARAACSTPTNTAKSDLKSRIPTKQTPSPRKNRKSIQESPNKVFSPTPTKKDRPDASNDFRPCSPVKRAIELDSPSKPVNLNFEFAGKLVPRPEFAAETHLGCVADMMKEDDYDTDAIPGTHPIPNPREFLAPVRKRRPTVKPQPEDIGQLMAKLRAENATSTTHEWVSSCAGEAKISPTPLHKASEKLQLKEPLSYIRISSNQATSAQNIAVRVESESTVIVCEPREMQRQEEDCDTASQKDLGSFLDLYTVQKPETLQHPTLHDSESASNKRQVETRVDSGKQVDCQDTEDTASEAAKGLHLDPNREPEKGLSPNSQQQANMQNLQKIKCSSLKAVSPALSGPTNLTEPPSAPDSDSVTGPQKVKIPCGIGSLRKVKSFHYDSESLPRVMTGSPSRPTLSRMPRAPVMPRRLPGKPMPALAENNRNKVEKPGIGVAVPSKTKGSRTSQSANTTPSIKPARPSMPAPSTLKKVASTPNIQASLNSRHTSVRPKSYIPSVNPSNSKASAVPTPKQLPFKPCPKPITPPSHHESNTKPLRSILKPTSYQRPPIPPTRPKTFDGSSALRRQPSVPRLTPALPKRGSLVPLIKGWTKTPVKPTPVLLESTTPEGSPPNPNPTTTTTRPITLAASPSPSPSPQLNPSHAPRNLPLPPERTRSRHAPPRYLSPNPSFPVVKRSRASTSPSPSPSLSPSLSPSPSPSAVSTADEAGEGDPNALRTPSKTIIHSLDKAIDAKIAEDALRGLLLLEAREKAELEAREDEDVIF